MEYHSLKDVSPGSYNWRIKARIIRIWRGVANNGQPFKGFNLLLLDDKKYRLHAFVPGNEVDANEKKLKLGNIYKISNFVVKKYREDEKFRCIHSDKQIVFTSHTNVEEVVENDSLIEDNKFDFYELEDLKDIADDNTYLTDVIGVMEMEQPLEDFTNKKGFKQVKIQFNITDGRCSIRVTFWDMMAKELDKKLKEDLKHPKVIIIASCKITSWQEVPDISSATATKFYINYSHHSVTNMRKLLSTPLFSKHDFSIEKKEVLELLKLQDIKNMEAQYIMKEVFCKVKFVQVQELDNWFVHVCTSCYRQIDLNYNCVKCKRIIPYPERRFIIYTKAADETTEVDIILRDREVRTIIGKDVDEILKEDQNENKFPNILKSLEDKEYFIKLNIRNRNKQMDKMPYTIDDIYQAPLNEATTMQQDTPTAETSTSTYHLDGLSQLNFETPEISKNQTKKKMMET